MHSAHSSRARPSDLNAKAEAHRERERAKAARAVRPPRGLTIPPKASASGDSRSPVAAATTVPSTRF